MGTIGKILNNLLELLYVQTGFCIILAILFMFLYLYVKEYGWKTSWTTWWSNFRMDKNFRRIFIIAFYVAMVLFRTLLNRETWMSPLSNLMGGWKLYDQDGNFTTESIENVIMFIPLTVLFFVCFRSKVLKDKNSFWTILGKSILISFVCSLGIEFLQLFLRLGTFQLSDLFYNTLGGLVGGFIYWCGCKITNRNKKR